MLLEEDLTVICRATSLATEDTTGTEPLTDVALLFGPALLTLATMRFVRTGNVVLQISIGLVLAAAMYATVWIGFLGVACAVFHECV